MATTSASSLVILSSFHPRFRMSVRQPMSFSHSAALARKTRRSATFSQCGGYGVAGGGGGRWGAKKGGGGALRGVLFFLWVEGRGHLPGWCSPRTPVGATPRGRTPDPVP